METEVTNFIRKTLETQKLRLNELIVEIKKHFQSELLISDLSFIIEKYRSTLTELWIVEFAEKFSKKTDSGEIGDDEVIELLEKFRGLNAFDNTPHKLQGLIYELIKLEKNIFISKDFLKPRKEICSVLTHKLMSLGQKTWNEFQLFENLIEVMRNSHTEFDDLVAKLKLQDFVNGKITVYQLSRNVLRYNFAIEKYDILREVSTKIINKLSHIQHVLRREIGKFITKLISMEVESGGKKVWLLQRKIMTSKNLNSEIGQNIKEIHIVCDILHIDQDLPSKYRGKNIFLLSNTIRLHQQSTWDLSGMDAPQKYSTNAGQYANGDGKNGGDGEAGESGGNCEIFSVEINNANFWTINSNGGNGSDGQDGGNGQDGTNGRDIKNDDFNLNGNKITNSNFSQVLSKYGISTEMGSRRCSIYENNFRKEMVFYRNSTKSDMIMIVSGSHGMRGGLGGFGGFCGRGGFAGKISVSSDDTGFKIVANDGSDGSNGLPGFNGVVGRNGYSAYMKVSTTLARPIYVLDRRSEFEFSLSDYAQGFSIFYIPFEKYLCVTEKVKIKDTPVAVRNTPEHHVLRLTKDDENFAETLIFVIKNSNKELAKVIKNLQIQNFVNKEIDLNQFASGILRNEFEIERFEILKNYAKFFTLRQSKLETQIRDFLREYIADEAIIQKSPNVYELKKKLLTSEDMNNITKDFDELFVVCDTLHINSSLSRKFRGKNLAINALVININKNIEWKISGCDNFLAIKANCRGEKCYENGGHCIIDCNFIKNPSMLKIISNGGNASLAQDGIDANISDFNINGNPVSNYPQTVKQTFFEGGLVKYLVKESDANYLLVVKGSNAVAGYNGLGENGGLPGFVEVRALGNLMHDEVDIISKNGNEDISRDGRDAFLYAKDRITQYVGLHERNRYDLISSDNSREYSVRFSSKFYYPKFSRSLSEEIRPDRVGKALYDNIVWVLRNSYYKYQLCISQFGLQDFANNKIPLSTVVRKIEPNHIKINCSSTDLQPIQTERSFGEFEIANYDDLKQSAKIFDSSDQEDIIRRKIEEFLTLASSSNYSNILTVKKKVYFSSNLSSLSIYLSTSEIRIICDTLHIDSDLPTNFRGKNVSIIANYVYVQKSVKWILSGEPVSSNFDSDAGQKPDGTGINGVDGLAGKSGGNFSLYCIFIENSSELTIESNGSDGTNGQNGGNGRDGKHGRNASDSSFKRHDVEWRILTGIKNKFYKAFDIETNSKSTVVTDDNLYAYVYVKNDWGLILLRGDNGTPGKPGGLPGYGGEGGYAGKISIKSVKTPNFVKIMTPKRGKDGNFGKPGYNGIDGKDGDDNWRYDYALWSNPNTYGRYENRRYRLSWSDDKSGECVYDPTTSKYVRVVHDRYISYSSTRQQNKSKVTRQREYKALAKKCASINMNAIINEFSKYLTEAKMDVQKRTSKQVVSRVSEIGSFRTSMNGLLNTYRNYLQTSTHKILDGYEFKMRQKTVITEPIRKSDVLPETSIAQYSDYLKVSTEEIEDITKKYSSVKVEMEMEQTQVQTEISVQLKFEAKRQQKPIESVKYERILYYDLLKTLLNGCKADELLEQLRLSRFSSDKYSYLAANISEYEIEETPRIVHKQKSILDGCIEKYLADFGNHSKNLEVIKFYKLLVEGNVEWKNCTESSQVLEDFIQFVNENYSSFTLDYFKSLIKDSKLVPSDLMKICEEKYFEVFFRGIYSKFIMADSESVQSSLSFATNASEFFDQIAFLRDNKEFSTESQAFNRHFSDGGSEEIKEVSDYFMLNILNFDTNLPEAIFRLLTDYADELEDIPDILNEFSTEASEILADVDSDVDSEDEYDDHYDEDLKKPVKNVMSILENTTQINLEPKYIYKRNIRKENFIKLLTKFFNTPKIIDFIKRDINSLGVHSILYRRILAHRYGIRLLIFARNFESDLKIVEDHNFDHEMEFQYKSRNDVVNNFLIEQKEGISITPQLIKEYYVLLNDGKFSTLEFENEKYKSFKRNQKIELQCKTVTKILQKQRVDEAEKSEVLKYLDPLLLKFGTIGNGLLSIFDDEKNIIDNETLIDIILQNFPFTIHKIDRNGTTKFIADEKLGDKIAEFNASSEDGGILTKYKVHNDQELRDDIKLDLMSAANINGLPIVKAIALCFFNNKNSQTLQEFSLTLKTILDLLGQKNPLKYFLTFLILGNEQSLWSLELALLKLEGIYGKFDDNLKKKWRTNMSKIKVNEILELFLEKVSELEKASEKIDKTGMDHVIDNMQYFGADHFDNLKNSNLSSWKLMTTEKFWKRELNKLKLSKSDKKFDDLKVVFEDLCSKYGTNAKDIMKILQEKRTQLPDIDLSNFLGDFNSGKFKLTDETVGILVNKPVKEWTKALEKHFSTKSGIRNAPEIVRIVESDQETSKEIKQKIKQIGQQAQQVFKLQSTKKHKRFIEFTENEILEWIQQTKKSSNKPPIIESLAIITRVFQLKNEITLRDTQLMSILTMWNNDKGVLMQVSTGEGKTFIGVSFAVLKVLYGEKVDVITSSSVLAMRDGKDNKTFFNFFGISVDHNCHEDMERRKRAYGCEVIYGVLGNFQRDYLLTEFFDENFMSGHHFSNVLVDEVDSMLLDKGNNILYLSSSLPDIDEVESVFLFIWQYVNQGSNDPEEAANLLKPENARKIVLDNAYGLLEEDDIKNMKSSVNADEIINKLKNAGIIDEECAINDERYLEIRFDLALKECDTEIREKIKKFCRNKIEGRKQIKIPKYLKKFVSLHLNNWIESAVRAMYLRNESEYVVDKAKDGQRLYSDPSVIIMDLDTGTDMTNSQWDEALHQFLQFKHGCKLSLISLKSVFISNVTYFKKYHKIYGMTGTLGNIEERNKTTKLHKIDFVTLPRYIEQRFHEYPPILDKNPSVWIEKIYEETLNRFKENRSVLIICETILDTRNIQKSLLNNSSNFSEENVHVYQRDDAELKLGKLNPKHAIVATNLAGRGTDIKLSDELKESGGLHVILSYLPQNARIENQAFGRASRSGDRGSARLIICTDSVDTNDITKLKEKRNHNELQRLDEVNSYYQNFITIEEEFFGKFHAAFRELKMIGNEKDKQIEPYIVSNSFINNYGSFKDVKGTAAIQIYLDNFKLQWSFWLDENSKKLEQRRAAKHDIISIKNDMEKSFQNFLSHSPPIHPVKQIELFILHNEKNDEEGFKNAKKSFINDNKFRDDSVAFQYIKCFEMIKNEQIENGYKNRSLTESEERELTKCLRMLNNRIHSRSVSVQIANSIKDQYKESLVSIAAYEKQQKALNEIDEIFIDSIQNMLGKPVNPENLTTTEIKLEYLVMDLHDELIAQNALKAPQISRYHTDEDIRIVATNNKIQFEELKKFINQNSQSKISSMKNFGEKLKSSIKLPSREEFWSTLVKKGILSNEIEYAIIDMNVLRNVDPSVYDEIGGKFKNEKLTVNSKAEIFFANINAVNEDEGKFKVAFKAFKSQLSNERFNFLMNSNVIQINKRAEFNVQKHEELRNIKIFDNFDEINRDDFKQVCRDFERIIQKITKTYESDRTVLVKRGASYALNYKNIDLIEATSDADIFGEDEVYQSDILNLITNKFAYRIVLENVAEKIKENMRKDEDSKDLVIHLHISPHLNVINDFIGSSIIEFAKADKGKFDNISTVKRNLRNRYANAFKGNSFGFTKNTTANFMNANLDKMSEDFESLEKKIKESIQALSNEEIEKPDVVLKPLREFLNKPEHFEMLEILKLKGFDMVIKVELKKYSATYWWRFAIVMIIALTQIVVGALLMVLSKGIFYKIGESLIQEGVGDAIFALGTLKNGHFTWKDYGDHKLISILTTLAFGVARAGLSKVKFLKRFFQESQKINNHMLSSMKDKSGTILQLIKSGGNTGKGAAKEAFKLFATTVASNVGKAITQAAIGMGADFAMEAFLDETTKRIAQYIVDSIQNNFWIHDISKTIDKLLQFYSPEDLKEKVLNSFKAISEAQKFWTDIAEKVSDKVDDLLRTGQKISKLLTFATSLIAKLLEMSSVTMFAHDIFRHLNGSISDILRKKTDRDKIDSKLSKDDVTKLKQEILDHIKVETTEKFKNAINSTAIKPALSFAANAVVNQATKSFEGLINRRKEKGYAKKATSIIENSEDGKISEADANKVNKILAKSKNPQTYASLTELDVPMNTVGIEAAATVLKNVLGSGQKIEIVYEGRPYEFGDIKNKNAQKIELNLVKGHFENSKNSSFGNDCMYDALTDKIPALKDIMSPKEFRKQIAKTMVSDSEIIDEIKSSRKKYFMNIGFYGGFPRERIRKQPDFSDEDSMLIDYFNRPRPVSDRNDVESNVYVVGKGTRHDWNPKNALEREYSLAVGTYSEINRLTKGRRNIADIDHIPPKSIYKVSKIRFMTELTPGQMPCILIPKLLHELLGTTGGFQDCRNKQIKHLENGKFAYAVLENIKEYQKGVKTFAEKINDEEGYVKEKVDKKRTDAKKISTGQRTRTLFSNMRNRFKTPNDPERLMGDVKDALTAYVSNISKEKFGKEKRALITKEEAVVLKDIVSKLSVNNPYPIGEADFQDLDNPLKYIGFKLSRLDLS